jgi:hypothetical protein
VRVVLDRCGGNKRKACEALEISYHTLNSYLRFQVDDGEPSESSDGVAEAQLLTAESAG